MVKIKNILDVVTNSSSELFVLKSSKTKKQLDSLFKKSGSSIRVNGFSSDDWKTWLALGKPAEVEGKEISKFYQGMNGFFVDQDARNNPWMFLYENYLIRPTYLEPDENGVYQGLPRKFTDLQKKFCEDHLYAWIEESLADLNCPEHLRRIMENFKKDHDTFYRLPLATLVFHHKQEWIIWVLENMDLFPLFPKLLEIYGKTRINDLYGMWLAGIDEDFEGEIIIPESLSPDDYKFYRLS